MEFTGKIIAILQPRGGVSKTGNEWKSQEYVIENHDQYPRKMCFDVFGADKIEQFNIQMGEELTVSFDVDARQWQDRWFNSIRAWKVERVSATAPAGAPGAPVPPPAPTAAPEFLTGKSYILSPLYKNTRFGYTTSSTQVNCIESTKCRKNFAWRKKKFGIRRT